ncbi:MAG: trimeric intracellular cation channel family protein [Acholeplasmatales bacterium]|nr:trimeric intracellular cation channel family protein [Acholeplasmatales bacterium]
MDIETIKLIFGIIGTIAFSISGSLIAIENKLDLFGVIILGVVTACGGGLFRDIMIGKDIVMFKEFWYPIIAMSTSIIVFCIMCLIRDLKWENSTAYKVIYNIIDSLGLGTFVIVGASAAIMANITSIFPVVFYAVLTACGGGMLRDILVCKIPAIFRKHIYAVAAIIGALLYYFLLEINTPIIVNTILTVILVVVIRYLAFIFKWGLPKVHLKEQLKK